MIFFDEVYIVALEERKEHMNHFMEEINCTFPYFNAIVKKKLARENLIASGTITRNSELSLGEIACALSHLTCLDSFIKKNNKEETILVLEDDVKLVDSVEKTIKKLKLLKSGIPPWDVLFLGRCWGPM